MRIVQVTPYYAPAYAFGGVVRAVEGMAQALQARGHELIILTTTALHPSGQTLAEGVTVLDGVTVVRVRNWVPALRGRLNLSTPFTLATQGHRWLQGADVVHLHEFRTLENLLLIRQLQRLDRRVVLSPHGTLAQTTGRSAIKQAWDRLLSPAIARHIQMVVALTEAEAHDVQQLWQQWGMSVPVTVIPNGVDLRPFAQLPDASAFRARWGIGQRRVVLFMGRLHPRKGAYRLAQAFVQTDLPDTVLLIVGGDEGDESALRALNDPRIILTGYLDGQARLEALACADVFALPAIGEGLPMAVLEALACGIPVLLSPECYLPDAERRGAGVIVPPTIDGIRDGLTRLWQQTDVQRAHMKQQAQAWVREAFTWDSVAHQLETVYSARR